MDGTSPLACPSAIPSVFVFKVSESMPWHNQVKEEMYLDIEMVLRFYLYSSILTPNSSYQ